MTWLIDGLFYWFTDEWLGVCELVCWLVCKEVSWQDSEWVVGG